MIGLRLLDCTVDRDGFPLPSYADGRVYREALDSARRNHHNANRVCWERDIATFLFPLKVSDFEPTPTQRALLLSRGAAGVRFMRVLRRDGLAGLPPGWRADLGLCCLWAVEREDDLRRVLRWATPGEQAHFEAVVGDDATFASKAADYWGRPLPDRAFESDNDLNHMLQDGQACDRLYAGRVWNHPIAEKTIWSTVKAPRLGHFSPDEGLLLAKKGAESKRRVTLWISNGITVECDEDDVTLEEALLARVEAATTAELGPLVTAVLADQKYRNGGPGIGEHAESTDALFAAIDREDVTVEILGEIATGAAIWQVRKHAVDTAAKRKMRLGEGVLRSCARDKEHHVRDAVAEYPFTPQATLRELTLDTDEYVRASAEAALSKTDRAAVTFAREYAAIVQAPYEERKAISREAALRSWPGSSAPASPPSPPSSPPSGASVRSQTVPTKMCEHCYNDVSVLSLSPLRMDCYCGQPWPSEEPLERVAPDRRLFLYSDGSSELEGAIVALVAYKKAKTEAYYGR